MSSQRWTPTGDRVTDLSITTPISPFRRRTIRHSPTVVRMSEWNRADSTDKGASVDNTGGYRWASRVATREGLA
jgi:hypothetical protein